MNGRIAHLNNHFHLVGDPDAGRLTADRLNRLAQLELPAALDVALSQALAEDETVYVLRRVQAQLAMCVRSGAPDNHLVKRWAEKLAGSIMRTVARSEADVITFTNQAAYVAQFCIDLLNGRSQNLWYYHPFNHLLQKSLSDALQTVLLENQDDLPAILQTLYAEKKLAALLDALNQLGIQRVWHQGVGAALRADGTSVEPLFQQAVRLLQSVGWWKRPFSSTTHLIQRYLQTLPPLVDWQDRQSLTTGMIDIIHFLRGEKAFEPSISIINRSILSAFDWLDLERLQQALTAIEKETAIFEQANLPLPASKQRVSPRQLALLKDLSAAMRQGNISLNAAQPQSTTNALLLYAALIHQAPHWTEADVTTHFIQALLQLWEWWRKSQNLIELARYMRQGRLDAAADTFPQSIRQQVFTALQSLLAFKETGIDLLQQFDGSASTSAPILLPQDAATNNVGVIQASNLLYGQTQIETRCAGLFLLLRAVMDARLFAWIDAIAEETAVSILTPFQTILLLVALRWAGEAGTADQQLDTGLCSLAGIETPITLETLRHAWTELGLETAVPAYQTQLLRVLVGQRLISGGNLHLFSIDMENKQRALIIGEGSIWPWGTALSHDDKLIDRLELGVADWQAVTGQQPSIIGDLSAVSAENIPRMTLPDQDSELAAINADLSQQLASDWQAVESGHLGLPAADITSALFALALLRLWARWLHQFAQSSAPYLLTNFIRRPGIIAIDDEKILIEIESGPLDIILEMAGYLAPIERLPWLNDRRVEFRTLR